MTTILRLLLASTLIALPGCIGSARIAAKPYDVIVVGAGLSGLTVAKDLMRNNRRVLVLEATNRIGGRAHTIAGFSIPVDVGAAWLHGADTNPLTAIVDWMGFRRIPTDLDGPVFFGDHRLNEREMREYGEAYEATERGLARAHADRPASEFLPVASRYRALIASDIGPLESGAEIERTSSADAAAFQSDPDDFVKEGIGTWVQKFGRGVPVELATPVTGIRYGTEGDGGVLIETATGKTYRGRRVVVTVSTGVLAARRIAFRPELPQEKWAAIHGLPMGLLNKVVFQFDSDVLAAEGGNAWVLHQRTGTSGHPEVMAFVIKPLGASMVVGFYGAEQARRFEQLPDSHAIDYAKIALRAMYGANVVAHIDDARTRVTRWGKNPWTLGSYSAALPDASKMHAELGKPVGDRVFFAGEACGPPEFNGSLAAAYVAGLQASRQVQASLLAADAARERDRHPERQP
ncbi:MAG: FAD-dependent oxidoreductase [Planctomycetes bacterium]|nr:FAD-dependent oxidoreductase [Planctomycetota bacterium]MCB9870709.1 FAD-dependent oxidoreductase [Planctomycetota bacterium]